MVKSSQLKGIQTHDLSVTSLLPNQWNKEVFIIKNSLWQDSTRQDKMGQDKIRQDKTKKT